MAFSSEEAIGPESLCGPETISASVGNRIQILLTFRLGKQESSQLSRHHQLLLERVHSDPPTWTEQCPFLSSLIAFFLLSVFILYAISKYMGNAGVKKVGAETFTSRVTN